MIRVIKQYGVSTLLLIVAIFCFFNISKNIEDAFTVITNSLAIFLAIFYFVNFEKDIIIKIKKFVLNIKWPFHGKTKRILTNFLNFIIEKRWDIISYLFLFLLFLITLGQFSYLERSINLAWINKYQVVLTVLAILSGGLTFWHNRGRIEKESEKEQSNEELAEQRRKEDFPDKYPRINKIPVLKNIVRWMYKEGWGYSILLFALISLFFLLRLYNTNFINGSDNYNVIGIKNLFENGISYYKYSPITDFLMLKSVQILDFNFLSIKLPFIFYSFITFIFLFLIIKLFDKKLALVSLFLYTISPWAIIQSNITRDYSFDLMIASIVIYFSFIICRNLRKSKILDKKFYLNCFYFCLIPLFIILLYKFNRAQVLTAGIYVLITFLYIGYIIIRKININIIFHKLYLILIIPVLATSLYFIDKFPFKFGFHKPDWIFIEIFFNPLINSPWQWFHDIQIPMIFFISLFILGLFFISKRNKFYIFILLSSFIFGIVLYIFKFETHIEYIPVRYLYFLFIPYIIILSRGLLNLFFLFGRLKIFLVVIILFCFFNINHIGYAINPSLAYKKKGISNLQIDNIGIGRFNLIEVVNYMKNDLNITNESILILDGRYEEIILYSNRKMDANRALFRPGKPNRTYNIAQNTYLYSSYFGYEEILKALNHEKGYLIISEKDIYITNLNKKITLNQNNFSLNGVIFYHIKNINGFNFYYWNNSKNQLTN